MQEQDKQVSGVWVSFHWDGSGVWVFENELECLRHAVVSGTSVKFVVFGEDVFTEVSND